MMSRTHFDLLACIFSLAATSAFFFLHSAGTSDIFWQMKTGEILWGTKEFLRIDLFSFTFSGSAWANFEWLSEIIFYFVWRAGGFAALSVLSFSAGLGIATALFFAFSKLSGFRYLSLILIFAAFIIGAPRFAQLRPEIFGFFFFALVLFLLVSSGGNFERRVWLCIPVLVLWANLHASAAVGVLLIAIYIGSRFFSRRPKKSEIVFIALCVLAPLANPLGTAIYFLPLQILSQSYAMSVTSDWAAPAWFSGEVSFSAWGLLLLVSTSVAIMIVRRRVHIPSVVSACVFTIPGVFVSRFIPFAAILWGCVLAPSTSGVTIKKNLRAALCAAVLAVCVGAPVFFFRAGVPLGARATDERIEFVFGPPVGARLDESDFPVAAADFLEETGFRGNVFNDMAWGGYLIWRLYPEQEVFIDTRTHLYGDKFIREYADALFNKDAFERTAEKYNIGCVIYDARQILSDKGPLRFLFSDSNWKLMPRMGNVFVFMKKSSHFD